MLKKGISVLLIMVLILSTFTIIPFSVSAGTFPNVSGFPDFDMDCYVADLFINPDTAQYNHIIFEMNSKSTNKVMRDRIESNTPMMAAMTAWQVATFQASDTSHDAVTQLGYYESIILSSLNTSMKSKPVKDTFDNAYVKGGKMLFDSFKNILKAEYAITDIDLSDYNSLSAAKQTAYMNSFEKAFKQQHPGTSDLGKFTKIFGTIVKTGKATEECINLFSSYYHCSLVDDYLCEVINDMYDQCPDDNATMKTALMNISKACNGSLDNIALDVVYRGFDVIYSTVVDNTINGIIASQPAGLAFMIAQSIGKNVSNFLFSTDAICENYYKICCFDEFEKLVRSVTQYEIDKYKAERTNYNANVLFSAVGLMFEINEISCDISIEYADTIYEKSVAGIFLDNTECNNFKKTVEDIRKIKQETYYLLMTDYIFNLEEDYPEIYASYMKIMDEIENPIIHVTGINFSKKHMTIGLEDDAWFFWNNAEVTPSNATNRAVSYSTSDDSIVSIKPGNTLMIELHQTGTVTITATSEDGNFTDTMTIDVVEGHGTDGVYLEDPVSIKKSGKCGSDVYWNFMNNGTLIIYGNGEMNYGNYTTPWYNYTHEIKSVLIEYGVTCIYRDAFFDCDNLTSVSIPKSVSYIDDYALANCTSLTCIVLPESVKSIGRLTFAGCTNLADITIPESITSIGFDAFDDTAWLDNQPDGLLYTGQVAFKYIGECPESVTILDNTNTINAYAFENCKSLKTVLIPTTVTTVDARAFSGCTNLASVTIPNSVKTIGNSAFSGCKSLKRIELPDSVISIGERAFAGCSSLSSITVPDLVTSINSYTFSNCKSLKAVKLGNSVTSIGYYAFEQCINLISVIIPKSVKRIDYCAFSSDCINLAEIYYDGSEEEWGKITICDYNSNLYKATKHYNSNGPVEYIYEGLGVKITVSLNAQFTIDTSTPDDTLNRLLYSESMIGKRVYGIMFLQNGETIQPEYDAIVKIPCENREEKVYRLESNNTLTDMNAKYENGYLVFNTDRFSVYIVAEEKPHLLGDVDGDDNISIVDATFIQRHLASIPIPFEFNEKVSDSDEDGIISIMDATYIQRWLANLKANDNIGKPIS